MITGNGRGLVQIHDTGIIGRFEKLTGDPSTEHPEHVDVQSPVVSVVDIARLQEQSFLFFDRTAVGPAALVQKTFSNVEILDQLNQARGFVVDSFACDITLSASANILEVLLNFLWLMPDGTTLVDTAASYHYAFSFAGPKNFVLQENFQHVMDRPQFFDQDNAVLADRPRLGQVQFLVNNIASAATITLDELRVKVKLLY